MSWNIFLCFSGLLLANIIIWYQVNGQFVWKSFANMPLLLSIMGAPISYLIIKSNYYGYSGFDGKLWPIRIIGFAIGTLIFGIMTWWYLGEVPGTKEIITILLCIAIILIQLFL